MGHGNAGGLDRSPPYYSNSLLRTRPRLIFFPMNQKMQLRGCPKLDTASIKLRTGDISDINPI